jgi:hypothetical protein
MRHFSRRCFAKLLAAPLTASIVQIAKSDETEAQGSSDVKPDTAKAETSPKYGPLHPVILPNYVKPNQLDDSKNKSKNNLDDLGTAVIFVQLVSPDGNDAAYIRYKIHDQFDKMGNWHDKDRHANENNGSTLFSTLFQLSKDISVSPVSGEVVISDNNGKIWVSTALDNKYADDDVTWNELK